MNCSQSTNDVYPTAIRLAVLARSEGLVKEQEKLAKAFRVKAEEFADVYKVGRRCHVKQSESETGQISTLQLADFVRLTTRRMRAQTLNVTGP